MIDKPPGLPFLVVSSALAAAVLVWASYPSWHQPRVVLLAVPVVFVLVLYWTVRVVWADLRGRAPEGVFNRTLAPCYIAFAVLLALVTDAPFLVRYTLSEPGLRAYAAAVAEEPQKGCRLAGLYVVCGGARYERHLAGSAYIKVRDVFGQNDKGFVRLPSGEPEENADGGERYTHLGGPWYSFWYDSSW